MDARPFVERALDDESVTDGLEDAVAKPLVDALVKAIESAVGKAKSESDATARTKSLVLAARSLGKAFLAKFDDGDDAAAQAAWKLAGARSALPSLPADNRVEAMRQLLAAWEAERAPV